MATPPVYDNRTDQEKHAAYAQQGLPEPPWASFQQDRMGPMPTPAPAPVPPPAQQPQVQPQGQQMTADPVQAQQQMMERTGQPFRVEAQGPEFARSMGRGDFYGPGAMDPFVGRTAMNKGYGGDPIFLPKVGQAPMSVLAERQSALNKERQRLEQEKQQFDPYADFTPVIPPAYQKSWQQAINSTVNEQLQATVELYGGDEMAAYKALRDPMSKEGRAWRQKINDINTTTNQVNRNFENALGYVEAVDSGAVMGNDMMYDRAKNLIAGLEGFDGDWAKLGSKAEEFENIISLDKYIKDYGMQKRFMDAYASQPGGIRVDREKGLYLVTQDTKETADAMKEEVADFLANRVYRNRAGINKATILRQLDSYFPDQVEQELKVVKPNAPKGGGKGSGDAAKYVARAQPVPRGEGRPDEPGIILTEVVGGRERRLSKARLFDFDGNETDLYGAYIRYNPSRSGWDWVGASLNDTEYSRIQEEVKKEGLEAGSEAFDNRVWEIVQKKGRTMNYRVEDNQVATEIHLGGFRDPNAWYASKLGLPVEVVEQAMKDPADRADIMRSVQ